MGFRRECGYVECDSSTDVISHFSAGYETLESIEAYSGTARSDISDWSTGNPQAEHTANTYHLKKHATSPTCPLAEDPNTAEYTCDGTPSQARVGRSPRLYGNRFYYRDNIEIKDYGSYAANAQSWYKAAKSQPRDLNNARMGQPLLDTVSFTDDTGDASNSLLVTFSQAFHDTQGLLVGVFKADCSLDFLSEHLQNNLPSDGSASVIHRVRWTTDGLRPSATSKEHKQ